MDNTQFKSYTYIRFNSRSEYEYTDNQKMLAYIQNNRRLLISILNSASYFIL